MCVYVWYAGCGLRDRRRLFGVDDPTPKVYLASRISQLASRISKTDKLFLNNDLVRLAGRIGNHVLQKVDSRVD